MPLSLAELDQYEKLAAAPVAKTGGLSLDELDAYDKAASGEVAPSQVEPTGESTGFAGTVGRGLAMGTMGIGKGIGAATRWAGEVTGIEPVTEAGKVASEYWEKSAQDIAPKGPEFQGTFVENPSVKKALLYISQAAPSLAAALTVGTFGGPVTAAASLGLLEGAPQYEEARDAGKSVKEASELGVASTVGTSILEFLPISRFLKGIRGGIGTRAVKGGVMESGQEMSQQLWQNLIAKYGYDKTRSLAEGIVEAGIGAAGTGAIAGTIFRGIDPQDIQAAKTDLDKQVIDTANKMAAQAPAQPPAPQRPPVEQSLGLGFKPIGRPDTAQQAAEVFQAAPPQAPAAESALAFEQVDPIQQAAINRQRQIDRTYLPAEEEIERNRIARQSYGLEGPQPAQEAISPPEATVPPQVQEIAPVAKAEMAEESLPVEPKAKEPKQVHDYSNTQIRLPDEPAEAIRTFAKNIPETELYTDPNDPSYGREDEPHVTVRYGLATDNPQDVEPAFKNIGPIKAKMGKVSIFETDKYDVVKVDLESPDLDRANKAVGDTVDLPGETHKDYKPHATIAYVKKGEGKKYIGDRSFEGQEITVDAVDLTDRKGNSHTIKLAPPVSTEAAERSEKAAPAKPGKAWIDNQQRPIYSVSPLKGKRNVGKVLVTLAKGKRVKIKESDVIERPTAPSAEVQAKPELPGPSKKEPIEVYIQDSVKYKNSGGQEFYGEVTKVYDDTVDIQPDGSNNSIEMPKDRIVSIEREGRYRKRAAATQKIEKDEIKITGPAKDKEVTVDIPKKEAEALSPKEQKAYLLAEIDKAILDQAKKYEIPVETFERMVTGKTKSQMPYEATGWYKFFVPGDGEFHITGSQLFEFKKKAQGFPTAEKFKFTPESYPKINFAAQEKKFKEILGNKKPKTLKPSDLPMILSMVNVKASDQAKSFFARGDEFSPEQFRQNFIDWLLNSGVSKEVKDFIREAEIPRMESKEAKKKPAPAETAEEAKGEPGKIEDFGKKLGGARKDISTFVKKELSDDDIANQSFSEIWPKAQVDAIEDNNLAAIATAIRGEVPSKPRTSYKLRRWVDSVKMVRELMRFADEMGSDQFLEKMSERSGLKDLISKIKVLQMIDRNDWNRIGSVSEHPDAYSYDKGRNQTPSPYVSVNIDGKYSPFKVKSVSEAIEQIKERLAGEAPEKKMKFEVRGRPGKYFINKTGDPLYRPLKEFSTPEEARKFRTENYDALVMAWEQLKEQENVKETDVRSKDNRPRVGADHRKGKDATPEMFMDAFGFRGVEFGNWVSQGKNIKERQGMLNAAYDALSDLADILGVPARAISLNGELGLGLGSRGHGWASAHYEPDYIVINLTKTRGAGSIAHEFFHALDHYFHRQRGTKTNVAHGNYITYQPETYYQHEKGQKISASRFNQLKDQRGFRTNEWTKLDDKVRPEVSEAFKELVDAINASPMSKRSALIDKGKSGGYWSRIIERAARAFENYVIAKMTEKGYHNDYLANVTAVEGFARDPGRYPYLLTEELPPIKDAFDNLFATIETKKTDKGVAIFSKRTDDFTARWEKKGIDAAVHETDTSIDLLSLIVPENMRGKGAATEFLNELLKLSDTTGKKIELLASEPGTAKASAASKLKDFYGHFGFEVITKESDESGYWMGRWPTNIVGTKDIQGLTSHDKNVLIRQVKSKQHISNPTDSDLANFLDDAISDGSLRNGFIDKVFSKLGGDANALYNSQRRDASKPTGRGLARRRLQEGLKEWGYRNTDTIFVKALGLTKEEKATQKIAKALGFDLYYFKTSDPGIDRINGVVLSNYPDVGYVNSRSPNPLIQVTGHEFVHFLKRVHPDLYYFLDDCLKRNVVDFNSHLAALKLQQSDKKFTKEGAREELYGDFVGDQWTKPEFWKKLNQENPSLTRRLADFINSILEKIKRAIRRYSPTSDKYFKDISYAQDVIAKVMSEAALRAEKAAESVSRGTVEGGPAFTKDKSLWNMTEDQWKEYKNTLKTEDGKPDLKQISTAIKEREKQTEDAALEIISETFGKWVDYPVISEKLGIASGRVGGALTRLVDKGTVDFREAQMGPGAPQRPSAYKAKETAFSKSKKLAIESPMTSKEGPGSKITTEKQPQKPEGGPEAKELQSRLNSVTDEDRLPNVIRTYREQFSRMNPGLVRKFGNIKPDDTVTIYRGTPTGEEIRPGDWVAIEQEYAGQFGYTAKDGKGKLSTKKVRADEVIWNGADANEYFYAPATPKTPESPKGGTITIYRGVSAYNEGDNYYSTDREWARQFTQSGRESEVKSARIDTAKIYRPDPLPNASSETEFDQAIADAKAKGFDAVWFDEGQNEPNSIFVINKKTLLPNPSRQAGEPGTEPAFSKREDLHKDTLSVIEKYSSILSRPKKLIEGKKDLSYFKDLIVSIPAFFKDKIPAVRSMFDATQERQDEYQEHIFYMENHDDVNVGKTFKDLPKDSYKKVGEYLVKTDQTQMGFRATFDKDLGFWVVKDRAGKGNVYNVRGKSKEDGEIEAVEKTLEFEAKDLQKQGYTPQEVSAVMAFRMSTNKGFETLFRAMRELIRNAKELGIKLPEIPVYRDGKSINISLNQAMAEMGDMRGFYFPRIRPRGRYVLTAKKEGSTPILETFNSRILKSPRVKELESQGYEVTMSKNKQLGEDVFEMAGQLVKTQQVINAALDKLDTRKDSDTTKKGIDAISDEIQSIFATAIAEQVSNVIKERGSRVHMTQRTGTLYLGYEEDPQIAIAKYIRGLAGGEAKRTMVMKMLKAFTGTETSWGEFKTENPDAEYSDYSDHIKKMMIDQREQPNAFKWGKAYIAETTRNPDFAENIVGVLRGAAVGKYLAFRVFSAPLVNLTALPTSTIASLKGAGISYGRAWKELGRGIQLYGKYRWNPKGMNANDKWIFDYMHNKGWDNAQFNSESLSVLRSTLGRGWDKIIDVGMFTFSESEKLNRAATIAAAFRGLSRLSKNKGKTKEEIAELAKQVSDDSHGIYNKGNYPYIALGGNPAAHIARMFYVFQRFSHTYFLNMKKLGFDQKDYGALAHMVVAPAVLAGAGASVLAPVIGAILKAFGMDDPEEKAYQKAGKVFGPSGETLARFGLAGLAGFSIKGSLALGVGAIPTSIKDIMGAPGSVMSDIFLDGIPMIADGNIEKGFEKIMPTGFGNVIRAYRESTEGLTTKSNRPIFYGRKQVKTEGFETLLRAISLYPARIAEIREKQYKEYQTESKYREKRTDIYARIKKFYLDQRRDPEKWIDIMAEIEAYNSKARNAGVPVITQKSIRTNLKQSFKPSKKERERR